MRNRLNVICAMFFLAGAFTGYAQPKPNIVWLMAEDISNDLECYGMEAVRTPNLNRLAEQGILYTNCFVSNPICSPNRSAMMVGVHPLRINAQQHRSNRQEPLPEPFKPFTYWLKKAGYTTIMGHEKTMDKGRKTDCNFLHAPLGKWDGENNFGLFDKYDKIEATDQPFFAQIQLKVTHRGDWWDSIRSISPKPVNPEKTVLPSYLADHPIIRQDWAKYLDQIEYMDKEVGAIVEDLKKKGVYENTVIIFIGDNGRCNIRGKGYLYDGGIRVPFILHWPKGIQQGKTEEKLVSTLDITATILDLAGIEIPAYMDGRSVLDKDFHRDFIFSSRDRWDDVVDCSRSLTTLKYKFIRNHMPEVPYDDHQAYLEFYRPAVHVMRKLKHENKLSKAQSLFFADTKPVEELYDRVNDPEELNNLALDKNYESLLKKMRSQLEKEEKRYEPETVVHHASPSMAIKVLEWVMYNYPEEYLEMLKGREIGYQKYQRMYNQKEKKP